MSSLLGLLILGWAIFRNVKKLADEQSVKAKGKKILKKDFQGVPIEVQEAIARGKTPPKSSLESTAFGKKKKQSKSKVKTQEAEEKVLDLVQHEELKKPPVLQKESRPLDFVESYDPAERPIIYQEIIGQPKCKRK